MVSEGTIRNGWVFELREERHLPRAGQEFDSGGCGVLAQPAPGREASNFKELLTGVTEVRATRPTTVGGRDRAGRTRCCPTTA